jgi:hypothetical protein
MTLWRQEWNGGLARWCGRLDAAAAIALAVLVAGLLAGVGATRAVAQATTERVVTNRVSGYAISGFDPVAYFVDGGPVAGLGDYEFVYDRAVWRFRNEGNLNAFRQHPEVYEPLFGGYDPVTVAQGKAVVGRPGIWAVVGSRLMLFSSTENRDTLLKGPRNWLGTASQRWPALSQELAQ